MKIRIKGNTVRYRLTKSEVETLAQTGYYKEETPFVGKTFMYAIKADPDTPELNVDFVNDTITMYLNEHKAVAWANNEIIGYNLEIKMAKGTTLSLLLEKDFVCMDNRAEDQSDNYPNPKLENNT
ncbi:hypothetical protein PP182_11110 [Maribacter sp. PR1]|uniref:Uncharacterized protein n=1 Tax=Maribacter cobaltidurans TaxID=1178778 RepID=A0ABU7IUP4_9FLAO|nr:MULTISPECIES: hypothetical protein [Maribacter]MDC6389232.1 hypothetical protein [Maribacter sp. PR1]MEE1976619.1 hypothetical protein [Maribacter cobaltidurans]